MMQAATCALALIVASSLSSEETPMADAAILPFLTPPPEYAGDMGAHPSLLRFADGRPVADAAAWPARRAEIIARWQELIGTWPALLERPAVEETARQVEAEMTRVELRIESSPGRFSRAILLLPHRPRATPAPAVIVPYYDADKPAARLVADESGAMVANVRGHAYDLCLRGYVTLAVAYTGIGESPRHDEALQRPGMVPLQPLHRLGWTLEHARRVLAARSEVDPERIGVTGFSFGGKWAFFAAAFNERFRCAAFGDPGMVFNEADPNCNYWEPWYLGDEPPARRKPGVVTAENPRTGPYRILVERRMDLVEIMALMAPRPFLVSGGAQDPLSNWRALNRVNEVYGLLGAERRIGLTSRPDHPPTATANEQMYAFFDRFL